MLLGILCSKFLRFPYEKSTDIKELEKHALAANSTCNYRIILHVCMKEHDTLYPQMHQKLYNKSCDLIISASIIVLFAAKAHFSILLQSI